MPSSDNVDSPYVDRPARRSGHVHRQQPTVRTGGGRVQRGDGRREHCAIAGAQADRRARFQLGTVGDPQQLGFPRSPLARRVLEHDQMSKPRVRGNLQPEPGGGIARFARRRRGDGPGSGEGMRTTAFATAAATESRWSESARRKRYT
jgi:hypothetical protein